MLLIRNEQIRTLARHSLANNLLLHAREVAPDVCSAISPGHLRQVVNYCLERCAQYRLDRDYDIYRYLNLMLVFGFTFDQDEPWAASPLSYPNPSGRMDVLMDAALRQNPTVEAEHES